MSVPRVLATLLALSTIMFLAACGSSGPGVTKGQCPPSGCFSVSNLNGTYVFSVSGTDENFAAYSVVGTFNANGSGGITGGTIDMNDSAFASADVAPLIAYGINSNSTYEIAPGEGDGRYQATLGINANPLAGCASNGNITLDFVMQDSFHGLVTEFDCMATGSGTIDIQTAGVTPAGSYAFSFAGATSSDSDFATAGNFTLTGSTVTSGLQDFNLGGAPLTNDSAGYPVSGTVVAGPSSTTLSSLTTAASVGVGGTIQFDVYPIDSTHLKFIEVDSYGTLLGDAFTESSTFPTGNLVFTLSGAVSGAPFAAGGLMVASGGTIGSGSSEDYNEDGSISTAGSPIPFTGTYSGANGRFPVALSSFIGGADYVAYPSSGGTFFLETDTTSLNIETGVANVQVAGAGFAASQGYGLNLTGDNLSNEVEVDDIAEFTAASSGSSCTVGSNTYSSDTLIGVTDENSQAGTSYGQALCGQYQAIDSTRTEFFYGANILNTGIDAIAYAVDGTTFPFIEVDSGQVSTGVFVVQNASASGSIARPHSLYVPPRIVRPHAAEKKPLK